MLREWSPNDNVSESEVARARVPVMLVTADIVSEAVIGESILDLEGLWLYIYRRPEV